MSEKIIITVKVSSSEKQSNTFKYIMNLFPDEPVKEYMDIPRMLFRHGTPDFETMLAIALHDYLNRNGE